MWCYFKKSGCIIFFLVLLMGKVALAEKIRIKDGLVTGGGLDKPLHVEYLDAGKIESTFLEIPVFKVTESLNAKITTYRNDSYQVVIHEIDRGNYSEINGEIERLTGDNSCLTLRVTFPYAGKNWIWFHGLDRSEQIKTGAPCLDTVSISTVLPPAGAFDGKDLADGGYGDPVGQGTMSFYPLCAVSIDDKGIALGIDMTIPVIYRLGADNQKGVYAEFDLATSPLTLKFPNRAFFKLCQFDFDPVWGMRAALKQYYSIYPETFKKRVVNEGIWLPFTSLRSIPGWEDFGFAFHETSWGSSDKKNGGKVPNILSDKGTGVLSFQYTEPWDIQLPIKTKNILYDTLVSDKMNIAW